MSKRIRIVLGSCYFRLICIENFRYSAGWKLNVQAHALRFDADVHGDDLHLKACMPPLPRQTRNRPETFACNGRM